MQRGADANGDGWQDLIVVGQFMPVYVFENHSGILENESKKFGLGADQRLVATSYC